MMEDQIISRLVTKGPTPSPPPALSDEFIIPRNTRRIVSSPPTRAS